MALPQTHRSPFPTSSSIKMADVVKESLNVAGLLTNIYSRSDLRDKGTSEPVVVLFFLHGRGASADAVPVDAVARAAFAWAAQRQAEAASEHWHQSEPRDFIVVTFVRGFFSRLDGRRSESLIALAGSAGPAEPWQENGG